MNNNALEATRSCTEFVMCVSEQLQPTVVFLKVQGVKNMQVNGQRDTLAAVFAH